VTKKSIAALATEAACKGEIRFEGPPCRRCGGTQRYTSSTYCCGCTARIALSRYEKKRALLELGRTAKNIQSLLDQESQDTTH
jgi:late competence protein required for DNA uptake (superfamily II DNA/RNA helicase)